eukprot:11831742-Karenia_brevis.AAC.1
MLLEAAEKNQTMTDGHDRLQMSDKLKGLIVERRKKREAGRTNDISTVSKEIQKEIRKMMRQRGHERIGKILH